MIGPPKFYLSLQQVATLTGSSGLGHLVITTRRMLTAPLRRKAMGMAVGCLLVTSQLTVRGDSTVSPLVAAASAVSGTTRLFWAAGRPRGPTCCVSEGALETPHLLDLPNLDRERSSNLWFGKWSCRRRMCGPLPLTSRPHTLGCLYKVRTEFASYAPIDQLSRSHVFWTPPVHWRFDDCKV